MTDEEDDDDTFAQWKQRKADKEEGKPKKRASTSNQQSSTSATKPATKKAPKERKNQVWKTKAQRKKEEEEEEKAVDTAEIPDYIKRRMDELGREEKRDFGLLRLPPSFENVSFQEDNNLGDLASRPDFGDKIIPSADFKDLELRTTGVIPAQIAQFLRDYQVTGVEFLHDLFVFQRGGILGDDMGLGKTVQVIAFLTAAFGKTGDERDAKRMRQFKRVNGDEAWYPRVLIICPGTLIRNWQSEFETWGWWDVQVYHGAEKRDALSAATSGRLEVLITTYTTYKMNKRALNMVEWDCVVADECHQIKGKKIWAYGFHGANICRADVRGYKSDE